MHYTEVRDFMEDVLARKPGSYEFKKELVDRAVDAVEFKDVNRLFGKMVLFKPDGICEKDRLDVYSEVAVRRIVKEYGIYDHIIDIIRSNALEEMLGDEFAVVGAQEFMEERAKKAIRMGDVTPLRMGLNLMAPDESRYTISGAEAEKKFRELGIWDYVLREVEKEKARAKMEEEMEEMEEDE